jgi:NAD(P)-dependent dehydrogenase (short-subunit alcohol dehydrogenase family)
MSGRLAGKVVCISGIGRGQGRAAVLRFAAEGARVIGCDLNPEEGARTAADAGGGVECVTANALEEADVATWIDTAITRHGRLDVLYNNAALTLFVPVHEMPLSQWQWAIRAELDVVFLGCKQALPHMMRQGAGVIINTASISALVSTELPGLVGGMAHAAGKAGRARLHAQSGTRVRAPRHPRQRHLSRRHRDPVQPAARRRRLPRRAGGQNPAWPRRHAGRHRARGALPRQ